jgi:putative ABC transport system permease protein
VVYSQGNSPNGGGGPDPGVGSNVAQQSPTELQAHASAIAASLGSHNVLALESTDATLAQVVFRGMRGVHGAVYVATPALLNHYGINPSAIDPTTLFITSRPGLEGTKDLQLISFDGFRDPGSSGCPAASCIANPKIQTFDSLPTDTSDPNLLVTTYAVHKLGLQVTPAAWLIQTQRPLTSVQINTARQMAASAGMTIETKSDAPSLAQLRNYATVAGILLALGVLAMTVGLIRSETASDLRTLTATGASSRTRRSITSATAGALGLLGALLGTAVAYLATAAFFRSQLSQRMSHVPVLDLLLVLVGLPLVATIGGWLLAGREPPTMARQALE